MPSLIDMRRRIRAVKATQQITKAMKMVAASRLRRAQERVLGTRPFALLARRVLASVASRVDEHLHPLLARRPGVETGPTMIVVVTSDRGLCGSFNTNIIKTVGGFIRDNPSRPITLGLIGRKGRDFFARRGLPVRFEHINLPKAIGAAEGEAVAEPVMSDYLAGKVDSVYIVYNEFKSVMQQKVVIEPLLPLTGVSADEEAEGARTDYFYEPSPERILDLLLVRLVQVQLLRAMLESNAAFFAAQMTAMDAATNNASDMIEGLTLYMNKVRQAAITREIIEVVSGAQTR